MILSFSVRVRPGTSAVGANETDDLDEHQAATSPSTAKIFATNSDWVVG
jgi:hypothetical protein